MAFETLFSRRIGRRGLKITAAVYGTISPEGLAAGVEFARICADWSSTRIAWRHENEKRQDKKSQQRQTFTSSIHHQTPFSVDSSAKF
jgi:hypothetical protein